MTDVFERRVLARKHDFRQELLVLDVDFSPLPASRHAEGSERCSMGRCRSKTGRKLVRVRAAQYQETVWEEVRPGRTAESVTVLQAVLEQAERRLGLDGDSAEVQAKRARTEIRLDSASRQRLRDHLAVGARLPSHGQIQIHAARPQAGSRD